MSFISQPDSPYSILQQRLRYVQQTPKRLWTVLVDNVPQWPDQSLVLPSVDLSLSTAYGPCLGYSNLIEAICMREYETNKIICSNKHILVTNGAMHALSLIFHTLSRKGTVALCQAPLLGSIATMLHSYGFAIDFFSTDCSAEELFRIITQPREEISLIYLNTPHNPTGDICSPEILKLLVQVAEERKIALVVDLVYDSFVFDGYQAYTPLSFSSSWSHVFAVNSLSKNYGAPGLRLGWIVSDPKNIEVLGGMLEHECISVCGWSQQQALHLLKWGNRSLIEVVQKGKIFVEEKLRENPRITFRSPAGGTHIFASLAVSNTEAFADHLLGEYGLALTTGSNYIGTKEGFVRIPTGYSLSPLERGLALLFEGLSRWAG